MLKLVALLGTILPAAAGAGCPVLDDLRAGVTLVQNAPFFRRADFQITAQGLREIVQDDSNMRPRNTVAFHGHGLALLRRDAGGVSESIRYDGALGDLDRLEALGEVVLTGEASDGGPPRPVAIRLTHRGNQRVDLAECGYDVWRIRREETMPGGETMEREQFFAPDLGLVLAEWLVAPDGKALLSYAYGWAGTADDVRR